jgi:small subunit ribosomal protein S16
MATKIRLQRHGKKGYAFYHVVVADSRAPRDGRFIEKLGTYNPNTNPATIDINFDRTLNWVSTGAEMSDTARAILSYKGVLFKNHLIRGVAKGALSEADVEKKFEAWLTDKESKISQKSDGHSDAMKKAEADRFAAERATNEARAKEIAAKNTPEPEEVVEEVAEETPAAETTEAPVEEKAEEAPKAEAKEEKAPEAKAEEAPKAEAPKAEAKEEKAEETPTPIAEPEKDPVVEAAKEEKKEDETKEK